MPQIGEIKRARELGLGNRRHRLIWTACKGCGKERWVELQRGVIRYSMCKSCAHFTGIRLIRNNYVFEKLYSNDFFYSMTKKDGYVSGHRLVMAKHLGRNLHSWEIVHHKNHIRDDNRIENLQLISDDSHKQITLLENKIDGLERQIKFLEQKLSS